MQKDYKPVAFWSWNLELDDAMLLDQVEQFAQAGLGGFFIHARCGLKTPYMGTRWFECCRLVCEKAKQCGLYVYLYDEDGWPSGFAGGLVPQKSEDYCQKGVFFSGEHDHENAQPLAAYRCDENGDYHLVWDNACSSEMPQADIYAFCVTNRSYADLTSKEAIAYFIQVTHQRYYEELPEYFGNVIRGIFTDEPQLSSRAYHFGSTVEREYEKRYGRSFRQDMWMLNFDGSSPELAQQIRHHYRQLLNQLMEENFTQQISTWCEEHGIVMTGHFACEDGLLMQVETSAGLMTQYQHFQMPGIDHLGRRLAPLPLLKQVQSVASQMNKPQVLSETFGCSGWNLSFEDMMKIWGWQAINGINIACLHLSAYSLAGKRKRDYPPVFSYQAPWWEQFHHVSDWIAHVSSFFAQTQREVDLLVLQPLRDMWRKYTSCCVWECHRLSAEFRTLVENLRNIQLDFDLGDEGMLANIGSVENGCLHVGCRSYSTVVVSETDYIEPETRALLKQLIDQGGTVLFIGNPPAAAEDMKAVTLVNQASALRKHFLRINWQYPFEVFSGDNFSFVHQLQTFCGVAEDGSKHLGLYASEAGEWKQEVSVRLNGFFSLWQIDPLTMAKTRLRTEYTDQKTSAVVKLKSRELVLLVAEELTDTVAASSDTVQSFVSRVQLPITHFHIERLSKNSLTIDNAELFCDGKQVDQRLPLHMIWEVLKELSAEKRDHQIDIRYTFENALEMFEGFTLAMEPVNAECIRFNGVDITAEINQSQDWFIDKCIQCMDISRMCRQGTNEVVCTYRMTPEDVMSVSGSFETEVNRFCPSIEPESIYILGDFSVSAKGSESVFPRYVRISKKDDLTAAPEFVLTNSKELQFAPLTSQDLWFYRGNVRYTAQLPDLPPYHNVMLRLKGMSAVFGLVQVNSSEPIPVMLSNTEMDITPYLQEKDNQLTLLLYGSNRNVFGPHHHCKGENDFIGTLSFDGVLNWTDLFTPDLTDPSTWIDSYAFVPFGIDSCEIIVTS